MPADVTAPGLYRAIVDPWLTIEAHNGRLLQRMMDTPQGSLHLGCLNLPSKVSNAIAEQYQEQRGLLAAWEVGKLTQGSDQQARQMRNRLRA